MRAVFMRSWPSRYLATVQPLPSSRDQVLDRHLHVVEEHLVHLVPAVHEDERAHGDARASSCRSAGRRCLPASCARGVGAHQAEDPVGVVRERGPGLLAVDDVVVALRARRASSATRGRSPSPAPNSPGTRSRRRCRCAAGSASSAPACRSAGSPAPHIVRPNGISGGVPA